jgi:hypothetical protein
MAVYLVQKPFLTQPKVFGEIVLAPPDDWWRHRSTKLMSATAAIFCLAFGQKIAN